jgi:hypothetical protein
MLYETRQCEKYRGLFTMGHGSNTRGRRSRSPTVLTVQFSPESIAT